MNKKLHLIAAAIATSLLFSTAADAGQSRHGHGMGHYGQGAGAPNHYYQGPSYRLPPRIIAAKLRRCGFRRIVNIRARGRGYVVHAWSRGILYKLKVHGRTGNIIKRRPIRGHGQHGYQWGNHWGGHSGGQWGFSWHSGWR